MKYFIRNCCSQIEEEADKKLKKAFWKALGVFIRLKIFPRIRQEKVNYLRVDFMLRLLVERFNLNLVRIILFFLLKIKVYQWKKCPKEIQMKQKHRNLE